jgi:hypothetical protein
MLHNLTKGGKMAGINNKIEEKLNGINISLKELQRLSRIMQACINDKENSADEDVQTIFQMIKTKIIEIKKSFNNILAELEI